MIQLMKEAMRPRRIMLNAIAQLRQAGFVVCALTNNWRGDAADTTTRVSGEFAAHFDVVVESAVEGVRKPDPALFQLCLDRAGVLAEESVFLDDIIINVRAAASLNFARVIHVNAGAVRALGELQAFLGKDAVDFGTLSEPLYPNPIKPRL